MAPSGEAERIARHHAGTAHLGPSFMKTMHHANLLSLEMKILKFAYIAISKFIFKLMEVHCE